MLNIKLHNLYCGLLMARLNVIFQQWEGAAKALLEFHIIIEELHHNNNKNSDGKGDPVCCYTENTYRKTSIEKYRKDNERYRVLMNLFRGRLPYTCIVSPTTQC